MCRVYFLTTYREEGLVGKLIKLPLINTPHTVASLPPIQKSSSWGSAHTIVSEPSPSFLTAYTPPQRGSRESSASIRVRRCGAPVALAGYHAGRDRAARQAAPVRVRTSLNP